MTKIQNPALARFIAAMGDELVLAQVLIRKSGGGFELRQAEDRDAPEGSLRRLAPADARRLAQTTTAGEFRPLKSAPTLARGWLISASSDEALETAVNGLYPGALADWHATAKPNPPVTNFREVINRQSGMYRIAAKLTDAQAVEVINATCGPACCLKRRWWSVADLPPDGPAAKSIIPCLEPCALLLEAARKTARAAQQAGAKLGENGTCQEAPESG